MIHGFVFDFDGLILDTETPLFEVYRELFAEYGVEISLRKWWTIIGTGHAEYDPLLHLTHVAGDHHHADEFRKLIDERVDQRLKHMRPFPGVEDFILEAHRKNIPMALASSSPSTWVYRHLDRLNLTQYFEPILTLDNVKLPKPDPELYQLAASHLDVDPQALIAFEDSFNGIKAAKAAGLQCIAIPNQMTRMMNFDQADRVVNSFSDLCIEDLLVSDADKKLI